MRRKKIFIYPHLSDRKGDLSKQWYVEVSMRNPKTGIMQRRRFEVLDGININSFTISAERYEFSKKIIDNLCQKLDSGWTIFDADPSCVYEDELQYSNIAKVYKKQVESNENYTYWCSRYIKEELSEQLDPKGETLRTYRSRFRIFGMWLTKNNLSIVDLSAIDNSVILSFFSYLRTERKIVAHTYVSYNYIIRNMFDFVRRQHGITENPVYDIPTNRMTSDNGAERIDKNDLDSIMAMISKRYPQVGLAAKFMYYCGMRPGYEIRLLRIGDIDFRRGLVNVSADIAKTDKARKVIIPDVFKDELINVWHLDVYNKDFYIFGRAGCPGVQVLGKNTLRNRFNQVREALKLPKYYKFYSFKHTGAVTLAEQGESIINIRDHLGHTSIESTEHYLKRLGCNESKTIRHNFPKI